MLLWKRKCAARDEALYSSTNGGSRYVFDPDYGGKVSMPKAGNPQPIRPDTTMSRHAPDASRPRALFADERSRYVEQQAQVHWQASLHQHDMYMLQSWTCLPCMIIGQKQGSEPDFKQLCARTFAVVTNCHGGLLAKLVNTLHSCLSPTVRRRYALP